MKTEKAEPEGKRIVPETSFRHYPLTEGWDFSVCIEDQCLIIFLTYDIEIIKYQSSFLLFMTFYVA